jgi:hypothetical protein
LPATPPPSPARGSPWASRLGWAAVVALAVGVALTAVRFAWPGDGPSWLGGIGGVVFYLGVVLVAVWTVVRLYGTSARLRARQRDLWDDRGGLN